MTIRVGDRIPAVTLSRMGDKGPDSISTDEIFNGKKGVLFALLSLKASLLILAILFLL